VDWAHNLQPGTLPPYLEFSVIPSGAHSSDSDVIYFSPSPSNPDDPQLYGLAFFRSVKNVFPLHLFNSIRRQ
jgi:hypothetical protein